MGPWNYPFQLIISPLTAAIAAGNSAVLKPSEYAPRTAEVIHEIIKASFDSDYICVVQGNADTAAELLRQPFDHVFYTGSTEVGRKVMTAAAKQLTPVTLELGGKSPAIVTGKARLPVTARRIARGKFMNAGQTCVAPDHVWVMESAAEALLHELTTAIRSFFGTEPRQSRDFGRIINDRHWQRLNDYLQEQSPVIGGEADPAERYIAPTVIKNPPLDSPLMQEEIFGPILPVLTYNSLDALLVSLRRKPTPLALYVFSESGEEQDRITSRLPSGGVCINDTIAHLTVPDLPFGGQGTSGMGAYHGRSGFDTFTHYRSILQRSTRGDMKAMYPPFSVPLKIFKRLYRFLFG
jgi:aldehyde dehydrogenase (NAD+)